MCSFIEECQRGSRETGLCTVAICDFGCVVVPSCGRCAGIRMKRKHAKEQRIKSARGREKSSDEIFVCQRVCTSKRMLKKVGAFSKDPIPDSCVTVCGVSQLYACARTVCVNQQSGT
ncbi:hypothetical protein V6N13_021237 [Hibiscus sabdariffa]|uniref:Uncharacterized protein n=1 Tax=Hibiscus sabdariffa TaxID=183260 RepID=A0ABR2EWF0_9ROSI